MWIVVILIVVGFLLWQGNKRRGQRFTRAVLFLNALDEGATPDEANGRVARLFTKHSTPEGDVAAMRFAMDRAQRWTGGNQARWLHEARQRGFAIDSGNTNFDLAHLHQSTESGKQVGAAVRNQILMPFKIAFSTVPEQVFLDPYVAGYTDHLISFFSAIMGVKPSQLSAEQFVSFQKVVVRSIVRSDKCSEFDAINSDNDEFKRGEQNARLLTSIILSPNNLDHDSSLMTEAANLATHFNQVSEQLGKINRFPTEYLAEKDRDKVALFWAVQTLTLGRHYEENYGLEVPSYR